MARARLLSCGPSLVQFTFLGVEWGGGGSDECRAAEGTQTGEEKMSFDDNVASPQQPCPPQTSLTFHLACCQPAILHLFINCGEGWVCKLQLSCGISVEFTVPVEKSGLPTQTYSK